MMNLKPNALSMSIAMIIGCLSIQQAYAATKHEKTEHGLNAKVNNSSQRKTDKKPEVNNQASKPKPKGQLPS